MTARRIHTRSTKYDGTFHWEYSSRFIRKDGPLVVTEDSAGDLMQNAAGSWTCPYDVRNHYWTDRWYNVMRFSRPGAELQEWYCNVSTPAEFDGSALSWIDLDLDVRAWPDGRIEVVDEDEFEEHSRRMAYPGHLIDNARQAVHELLDLAQRRAFPFDEQ
jgi:protein associated with RNAse G/E